uniref:putative nuclease HARBI1 n=1 Tax=Pristiophorus japonicus TaxID=55135 RepID=UPI00398EE52D
MELCNLLQAELEPQTQVRTALSVASKVTITLNFYATGSFQAATVDMCNISQFADYTSIQEVTDALYRRRADYISFPMTTDKQLECQTTFLHVARFPWVQGVIDCTQVSLRAPQQTPEQFKNGKGFLSLNVQLVCDHSCKIMQVDARFPGSSHDSFILCQSSVPGLLTGPNEHCCWLLGDKGYALSTWLMAPLRNPRTAAQLGYNESLTATRTIIELTIGILKQRFHCLDHSGGVLQYSPEHVSIFVVVCCMLHNLVIMRAQPLEDEAAQLRSGRSWLRAAVILRAHIRIWLRGASTTPLGQHHTFPTKLLEHRTARCGGTVRPLVDYGGPSHIGSNQILHSL